MKCLPHKHEDQSLDLQNQVKELGRWKLEGCCGKTMEFHWRVLGVDGT